MTLEPPNPADPAHSGLSASSGDSGDSGALDVRTLADAPDEFPGWVHAVASGFLRAQEITDEEVAIRREGMDLARVQGAYDGERCVGTFRTFAQELTVPGGAVLPSCAVTNVTVSPSHRRRGLLTRMMGTALAAAKERGEAVASLVSAEYPIYGRYGFGPAAGTAEWEVEAARTGLDPHHALPACGGRVDLVDAAAVRRFGPPLHERFRAQPHRQGAIDRTARWWQRNTGGVHFPGDDAYTPRFHALYRDTAGEPQGLVAYTIEDRWVAKLPENAATVLSLIATTTDAERALWHFLLSIDWVARVRSGHRPPDDVLPLLLPDPRAARITAQADYLWLRPLDVPRMLEARSYAAPGTLVLDLHDAAGLAGGRFRLEAGPDGAKCTATRDEPDLSMTVGELGTLYLGDESATRLTALGRVAEHREGAAATADALLRTGRRPWCPDLF